jgi:hypothetical protein
MSKIKKINNLKKAEGFIQLNYSKGFKYIDKAGEFFNHFYDGDIFPPHLMNPEEMVIKISEKIQLKSSPHNLWMHFVEPGSFEFQKNEFNEKALLVDNIFEPETYTRIGWRNYLIFECDKYPNIIPDDLLGGGDFSEISFTKKISSFSAKITISKLITNNDTKNKAVLFDIDLFKQEIISRDNFSKIKLYLNEIEKAYQSDELLLLINGIIDK